MGAYSHRCTGVRPIATKPHVLIALPLQYGFANKSPATLDAKHGADCHSVAAERRLGHRAAHRATTRFPTASTPAHHKTRRAVTTSPRENAGLPQRNACRVSPNSPAHLESQANPPCVAALSVVTERTLHCKGEVIFYILVSALIKTVFDAAPAKLGSGAYISATGPTLQW